MGHWMIAMTAPDAHVAAADDCGAEEPGAYEVNCGLVSAAIANLLHKAGRIDRLRLIDSN
jgi:hypothetical protein